MVLPVPPGGLQDSLARAIARELSKAWGQNVLIENRPGAGGIVAAEVVAKSAPDGYSILMADAVPLVNNLFLRRNLPYDPVKDFAPMIALAQSSSVLVTNLNFPANTIQELIAFARTRPGEVNYRSYGLGSFTHVETEDFCKLVGIKLTHIPYKGGAEILPALLSGQIAIAFTGVPSTLAALRQKQVKAIAYGGAQRSSALPELPTVAEAGVAGFEWRTWFGLVVRAATPRPILDRMAADVGRVIAEPAFRDKFIGGVGVEPFNLGPDAFAELLSTNRKSFAAMLKRVDVHLE